MFKISRKFSENCAHYFSDIKRKKKPTHNENIYSWNRCTSLNPRELYFCGTSKSEERGLREMGLKAVSNLMHAILQTSKLCNVSPTQYRPNMKKKKYICIIKTSQDRDNENMNSNSGAKKPTRLLNP